MEALDHPNIIKMYDWFEHENMLIMVLQYARGWLYYEFYTNQSRF